jgi:putative Ca2+/H+ antiporter (TMEM165/GDT1 family)
MTPDPWLSFAIVFGVIGGLEFGDRTSFALIAYAAKHPPALSWAGGASAFVLTTAISVGIGAAFEATFRGDLVYLRLGGGSVLLGYAAYLAFVPEHARPPPQARSVPLGAFLLIFLLELGDTTMIFTINFVFAIGDYLLVFAAAASALVCVSGVSSWFGGRLGERVEPRTLERVVVVILAAAGVVTIIYALHPQLLGPLG